MIPPAPPPCAATNAPSSERRPLPRLSALAAGLSLLLACAAGEASPLDHDTLANEVVARRDDSPALVTRALSLQERLPLALSFLDAEDARSDPHRDAFWHAHAVAFQEPVIEARRAHRAFREAQSGAGTPRSVDATGVVDRVSDPLRSGEVRATVDLLGLLGLGARAAEAEVAAAVCGRSLGELEVAVWNACFAVDRARLRLAFARRRCAFLRTLVEECASGARRAELLEETGRLGAGPAGRARAIVREVSRRLHLRENEERTARRELATTSGLPLDAAALDAAAVPTLAPLPDDALDDPQRLLRMHPELRLFQLEYALAEARVREAATAAMPRLRLGPRFRIGPDPLLAGGVLSFDLGWPSRVRAAVAAAVERREGIRERLASRLVAVSTRVRTLAAQELSLRAELVPAARHQEAASQKAWRGARAAFLVATEHRAFEDWLDALQLRLRSGIARLDAEERVSITTVELRRTAAPGGLR